MPVYLGSIFLAIVVGVLSVDVLDAITLKKEKALQTCIMEQIELSEENRENYFDGQRERILHSFIMECIKDKSFRNKVSNPRGELMRQTSLLAFVGIESALPEKRRRVLEAIETTGDKGATLFELVKIIGRPINELSGRVTELSKSGHIIDSGTRKNPDTKKSATIWIAADSVTIC